MRVRDSRRGSTTLSRCPPQRLHSAPNRFHLQPTKWHRGATHRRVYSQPPSGQVTTADQTGYMNVTRSQGVHVCDNDKVTANRVHTHVCDNDTRVYTPYHIVVTRCEHTYAITYNKLHITLNSISFNDYFLSLRGHLKS